MNLNKKIIISFLFFFLIEKWGFSAEIKIEVDKTRITLNEEINVTITMEGDFDRFDPPQLDGLQVTGRSDSSRISIINGVITNERILSLTLMPTRTGDVKIGIAKVYKGGRVIATSNEVIIKVLGTGQKSPSPEESEIEVSPLQSQKEIEKNEGEPFFIYVYYPSRPLYAGEPFFISYDLYIRSDVNVAGLNAIKMPSFEGFMVEEISIPKTKKVETKRIGRYVYEVYPQRRAVLTPLKPEKLTIDNMILELYAGGFFYEKRYRVSSDLFSIMIKDVPVDRKFEDYVKGTIGRFNINATISKNEITTQEGAVLTIEITGSGNLRGIKPPLIKKIDGLKIELLPSSDLDEIRIDAGGISGKRVFQYIVRGIVEGSFIIPEITLSFFDPVDEKFKRTKSEKINLNVIKGGTITVEGKIEEDAVDIADIIWDSELESKEETPPFYLNNNAFKFAILFPLFLYIIFEVVNYIYSYRRKNEKKYIRENAFKNMKKGLKLMRSKIDLANADLFYGEVDKFISQYFQDRLNLNIKGLRENEIKTFLIKCGVKEERIEDIISELNNIAFARFATKSLKENDMKDCVERVIKIFNEVEKDGNLKEIRNEK